ncbi:hypothetical protein SCUCBS95973_002081 [Sporothrix curviconia]|uniref:Carboxylesterase type B domain-containing protein n=1 Tax=Sporothrix curviconia TaxID=1260050 RepID=A0ABP0B430_9PEZI
MRLLLPAVLLSAVHRAVAETQQQPTVTVLNGTLGGASCASTDVNYFLSIPYANAPVDSLRFAPPQPYNQKYNGALDATTAAPACPPFNSVFNESTAESEDCLFIDVWAPANATASSSLPVRVWVFGGENEAGGISNGLYDGCFASTNTIQVSINYRALPNLTTASQGNAPYIQAINCSSTTTPNSRLTCLCSTPVDTLVTAFLANTPQAFGFVIDGTTIPAAPTHPLVPSIIGSTVNEGTFFVIDDLEDAASLNASTYVSWLEGLGIFSAAEVAAINETYPVTLYADSFNPVFASMAAVITYGNFRCPARQVAASAAAAGVPVWTYSYGHTPSCAWYKDMAADATPGASWPAYNASASMGVNVLNSTQWDVGTVDYSICAFWDNIIGSVVGGPVPAINGTNSTGNGSSSPATSSGSAMNASQDWSFYMLFLAAVTVLGLGW